MSYDINEMAKKIAKEYEETHNLENSQQQNEIVATKQQDSSGFSVKVSDIQDDEGNIDMNKIGANYFASQINSGSSLNEVSMDVAKASMTNDIFGEKGEENEKYRKELKNEQKKTIKESFRQDRIKGERQTMDEKRAKAESFYLSMRPILEFDFDNLVGNTNEGKEKKQYSDRSYGIFLMSLMLVILIVPYCVFSIVLALFNGVNATLKTISTFGKISRCIAYTIFIMCVSALVIYCAILGVEGLFNVKILP